MDLGVTTWPDFCRMAERVADWSVDLREVESVRPPGLVALCLLAQRRHALGFRTLIAPPSDPGMQRHLARMNFFARLDAWVKWEDDVGYLLGGRFAPPDRFTPLLSLGEHTVEEICDRVWYLLQDNLQRSQRRTVYSPIEEVLANVLDHAVTDSGDPAINCLQVHIYWDTIEMAVGDLGVGFRASLRANPQLADFAAETEALEAAIQRRRSRLGAQHRYRGGGLRRALDVVHDFGGHSVVQSYDGAAVRNPYDDEAIVRSVGYTFPGSIVWMRFPFQPS